MRDKTFPRHVHQWRELLQRGRHERTTFVVCDQCEKEGRRDSTRYLGEKATAEFRRQIKYGIKPSFSGRALIGYNWKLANIKRTR